MKIQIKKSKTHGLGIFAAKNIRKGEAIEECQIIILPGKDTKYINKTVLYNYYFEWKKRSNCIALGNGSLFNHSYDPNAEYQHKLKKNTLLFVAIKDIKKGEEITVSYNGDPKIKKKVWFDK